MPDEDSAAAPPGPADSAGPRWRGRAATAARVAALLSVVGGVGVYLRHRERKRDERRIAAEDRKMAAQGMERDPDAVAVDPRTRRKMPVYRRTTSTGPGR